MSIYTGIVSKSDEICIVESIKPSVLVEIRARTYTVVPTLTLSYKPHFQLKPKLVLTTNNTEFLSLKSKITLK